MSHPVLRKHAQSSTKAHTNAHTYTNGFFQASQTDSDRNNFLLLTNTEIDLHVLFLEISFKCVQRENRIIHAEPTPQLLINNDELKGRQGCVATNQHSYQLYGALSCKRVQMVSNILVHVSIIICKIKRQVGTFFQKFWRDFLSLNLGCLVVLTPNY